MFNFIKNGIQGGCGGDNKPMENVNYRKIPHSTATDEECYQALGRRLYHLVQVSNEAAVHSPVVETDSPLTIKKIWLNVLRSGGALTGPTLNSISHIGAGGRSVYVDVGAHSAMSARQQTHAGWLPPDNARLVNWRDPLFFPAASASEHQGAGAYRAHSPNAGGAPGYIDETDWRLGAYFIKQNRDANYLSHESTALLIKSVIELMDFNPAQSAAIADVVKIVADGVATAPTTGLAPVEQRAVVNSWIERKIFRAGVFNFLIDEFITLNKNVDDVIPLFKARLKSHIDQKLAVLSETNRSHIHDYILENIVASDFPFIIASPLHNAQHHIHWGLSHAGLSFAAKSGADWRAFTAKEAYALGYALYLQLGEAGVSPALVRFFTVPALFCYLEHRSNEPIDWLPKNQLKTEARILSFFLSDEQNIQAADPYSLFRDSVAHYKKRLEFIHPDGGYTTRELDRAFAKQNDNITKNFHDLDRIFISAAFSLLSDPERKFIDAANIRYGAFILQPPCHECSGAQVVATILMETIKNPSNVNLFEAKNAQETRIYALYGNRGGYQIVRVDKNTRLYQALLPQVDKDRFRKDFRLIVVYHAERSYGISASEQNKEEKINLFFSDMHKQDFRKQLDSYGAGVTRWEEAKDLLLNFVPFFNCINDITHDEPGSAVFDCGMDMIFMVPFLGEASALATDVGEGLAKSGYSGVKHVAKGLEVNLAAKYTLKESIHVAAQTFFQHAGTELAETLTCKQVISRGIKLAENVFFPFFSIGKSSFKQILRLGRAMEHIIPELKPALRKIERPQLINTASAGARLRQGLDPKVNQAEINSQIAPTFRKMQGASDGMPRLSADIAGVGKNIVTIDLPTFNEFIPIQEFKTKEVVNIEQALTKQIGKNLGNREYVVIDALKNQEIAQSYHLTDLQMDVKFSLDVAYFVIDRAKAAIKLAKQEPAKAALLHDYLKSALDTENPAIIKEAVSFMETAVDHAQQAKKTVYDNIAIVSTIKQPGDAGGFFSTLTKEEKLKCDYAFCSPSDPKNKIYVMADRVEHKEASDKPLVHIMVHEVSHLAVNTDDILYYAGNTLLQKDEKNILSIFNRERCNERFDLGSFGQKLGKYLNLSEGTIISDKSIYRAIVTDHMLRTNVMLANADNMTKVILGLAKLYPNMLTLRARRQTSTDIKTNAVSVLEHNLLLLIIGSTLH